MKKSRYFALALAYSALLTMQAQGFISDSQAGTLMIYRDPARQASTEIDAVVNNPAGTAFLPKGLSLSTGVSCEFGVQKAWIPGDELLDFKSNSYTVGPIVQIAYRTGAVSWSASISRSGGYGRRSLKGCPYLSTNWDYDNYSAINSALHSLNSQVAPHIFYFEDFNANRVGLLSVVNVASLYNWEGRLGAAFRICSNVSLYGGVKVNRIYNGQASTIVAAVEVPETGIFSSWDNFMSTITYDIMSDTGEYVQPGQKPLTEEEKQYFVNRYLEIPVPEPQEKERIEFRDNCLSVSPVVGIDIKAGAVNFGAKYEFASIAKDGAYKVPAMASAGLSVHTSPYIEIAAGASAIFSQKYFYGREKDKPVYNISAGVSYFPHKEWIISGGLTYSRCNEWAPEAMPIACDDTYAKVYLSCGCAYNFNRHVQFNFGFRSALNNVSFSLPGSVDVRYRISNPVQFAFGLNFHFDS